jgi:hypothetical protein
VPQSGQLAVEDRDRTNKTAHPSRDATSSMIKPLGTRSDGRSERPMVMIPLLTKGTGASTSSKLSQSQFWTPIPRLRGSKLGSDALSVASLRRPQQPSLEQIDLGAAVHLPFDELELGDLPFCLTV